MNSVSNTLKSAGLISDFNKLKKNSQACSAQYDQSSKSIWDLAYKSTSAVLNGLSDCNVLSKSLKIAAARFKFIGALGYTLYNAWSVKNSASEIVSSTSELSGISGMVSMSH